MTDGRGTRHSVGRTAPGGCYGLFAVNEQHHDKGNLMESQVFSPAAFSLSAVDLIPLEDRDDDEETRETDARLARYAQVAKLVDADDIVEIVCTSLKDSTQLR
jgi:hypothetical protein